MNTKLYSKNKKRIVEAIRKINLKAEAGDSGALENLEDGMRVVGGSYVRLMKPVGKKRPIIAWGAAFENGEFQLFVKPGFRGKKIASRIIEKAKQDFPNHVFCPWNKSTKAIFEHKKVDVTNRYLPYGC